MKKQKVFKNTSTTSEFSQEGVISGGNTFDTYNKLKIQEEIDLMGYDSVDVDDVGKEIKKYVKKYIDETVPKWWVLMQEQANYFTNQFNWKHNDAHLKSLIINAIRGAFYNGIGGIYYNDITNDFESVIVSNIKYNASSRIVEAKYILSHNYLSGIKDNEKGEWNALFTIPESKIKNLAIFKWGTEALNAWIRLLPYVKNQEQMMRMLTLQKFSYNKKLVYTCNSPTAAKKEMKLYFDPDNPFIVKAGFGGKELSNLFDEVKISQDGALDFIEFYKEQMGIIYSQIGRRQNVDTKKERNVSSEVEASQENYDVLLKDVFNQFEIFVENVNNVFSEHGAEKIQLIENEQGGEQDNETRDNLQESIDSGMN